MFKKAGTVTIAVTAGLLAAAPFASAGEAHGEHDGGHHKKNGHHEESSDCNVTAGDAEANGGVRGNPMLGNTLTQAPLGGNNLGNIVCNDILNNNLSGNNISVSVLGEEEEPVVVDQTDLNDNGIPDAEETPAS